ncbi:anther-specific protein LAT52-like [Macadamia integrifolia]|uniref:anther-specific protein LAT52-like n=1 Tax=Macadamia integrifolia TaxID=60698 RepID=UPI001C4FB41D|nr:anther-specific protein LAT52-like [Macadamia integrifolia]
MPRVLMLFALYVIPALVSTCRPVRNSFVVVGKVCCDTCRCGFETFATTYMLDLRVTSTLFVDLCYGYNKSVVRVQCKDKDSLQVVYNVNGVTDATWAYKITIPDDHEDEICETVLISSPQNDCKVKSLGRDGSREKSLG